MKIVVARSPASADALGLLNDDRVDLPPCKHRRSGKAPWASAYDDRLVAVRTH